MFDMGVKGMGQERGKQMEKTGVLIRIEELRMAGRGGVVSWVKVSYSWHSGLVLGRNPAEPADLHLEA
jgi:hypothetical protein